MKTLRDLGAAVTAAFKKKAEEPKPPTRREVHEGAKHLCDRMNQTLDEMDSGVHGEPVTNGAGHE